jgi:hypothetical protein
MVTRSPQESLEEPLLPAMPPQGHVPTMVSNPLGIGIFYLKAYDAWLKLGAQTDAKIDATNDDEEEDGIIDVKRQAPATVTPDDYMDDWTHAQLDESAHPKSCQFQRECQESDTCEEGQTSD